MAQLNFDASNVEPRDAFDLIPAGWYEAEITASEERETKAGDGSYHSFEWTIIGPTHAGRKVWSRLNLNNPNRTAVEIAQRDLSAICRATGVMTVRDSSDLHGKPVMIKVKIRKGNDGYDDSNDIAGYKPREGSPANSSNGNGGSSSAPWTRRG